MNRQDFVRVLRTLLPAIDKVPNASGFHTIASDGQYLYTNNGYLAYRVPCATGFKGAFVPHKLLKMIDSWNVEEITFTVDENTLVCKGGRSKCSVQMVEPRVIDMFYNLYSNEVEYKELDKTFTEVMQKGIITNNTTVPGIYVSGSNIVATNNAIIFNGVFEGNLDHFRMSERTAVFLFRHTVHGAGVTPNWVQFNIDDGGILMIRRQYDFDYPIDSVAHTLKHYQEKSDPIILPVEDRLLDVLKVAGDVMEGDYIEMVVQADGILVKGIGVIEKMEDFVECPVEGFVDTVTMYVKAPQILPILKRGVKTMRIYVESNKIVFLFIEDSYLFAVGIPRTKEGNK